MRKRWGLKYAGFLACLGLMLMTLFWKGVFVAPDTSVYVSMSVEVQPGYPLFLAMIRMIIGENGSWLFVAALLQNIFTAFAVWRLAETVRSCFHLGRILSVMVYVILLIGCYSSLFAANTHFIMMNSILTEGLVLPFYFLFFRAILYAALQNDWRSLTWATVLITICTLIRGQFEAAFLVLLLIGLFIAIRERAKWMRYAEVLVLLLCAVATVNIVGKCYAYGLTEERLEPVVVSGSIASHVLMVAEEDDAKYFEDKELREIFTDMLTELKNTQCHSDFLLGTILARGLGFEDWRDDRGYVHDAARRVMNEVSYEKMDKFHIAEENQGLQEKLWCDEMIRILLPKHFGEWLYNYFALALVGLIRSVAMTKGILSWIAIGLYVLAFVLMILAFRKKESRNAALFMLITLLCIATNSFSIAVLTMCLSRYMIYNLPFFYIAGLMLVRDYLVPMIKNAKDI